jgi:predicted HTH transcriptional regulator
MGHEDILKYVSQAGYRTKDEIRQQFSGKDSEENIDMYLDYLVSKNRMKMAKIHSDSETYPFNLYYVTA